MAPIASSFYSLAMQSDPLSFFRLISGIGLAVSLLAGFLVYKNADRLFGIDPAIPSETESARTYSQLLVGAVLIHAVIFFCVGLLFL